MEKKMEAILQVLGEENGKPLGWRTKWRRTWKMKCKLELGPFGFIVGGDGLRRCHTSPYFGVPIAIRVSRIKLKGSKPYLC